MSNVKLDTPAQYLKGVGPKIAKLLLKLGVETIEDLIYFFPRDYEDRTNIKPIGELRATESEIIRGEVVAVKQQTTRGRFSVLKVEIADASGSIQAVWFNQPYLTKLFRCGLRLILSGKVEFSGFDRCWQFIPRDFEIDTGLNPKIVPYYPLTEGLFPKKVRAIVQTALDAGLGQIVDFLPESVKAKYELPGLAESISSLHFPENLAGIERARRRLAFDDFFFFQLGLGLQRGAQKARPGIKFKLHHNVLEEFIGSLPFKLTPAQLRVLDEVLADMHSDRQMLRLIQGDVGSGKTIVAALASLFAVHNGYQVALMAPTEILAGQHFQKLQTLFQKEKLKVQLLTGSANRKKNLARGLEGADVFVGTHALIQEKVKFEKLGLAIIDEQHRFGVLQRALLVKKGSRPDVLVMTATPIPRSLALTLYGDLDRSVIDELPPGRKPVKTYYVSEDKRPGAYEFMRQKIRQGRQVFVVCPLVEESEKVDLKAALDEADRLQKDIFPEFKVGLIHGKMKGELKDKIMKDFVKNKIQVLVSTTVIEVGIDVPNATIIVIEHCERFGLSQLHQLRGRIGRGADESFCFLIGKIKTSEAKTRVKAMLDSTDGFYIAEIDLKLRGPGDFCGTRQSGLPNFRVADIIRDEKILRAARAAAFELITENLDCARNIWQSQRKKTQGAIAGAAIN